MRPSMAKTVRASMTLLAALAAVYLLAGRSCAQDGVTVTFRGGAREVGGSCQAVDTGKSRFLVDCGALGGEGSRTVPPDASRYSFVILTHAHTDHCGLLPELYDAGFEGKVYCTPPTAGIVPVMLRMSRSFSREKVPLESFKAALAGLTPVEPGVVTRVGDVSFTFRGAGHLIGAAFVEVDIEEDGKDLRIVFSGDLGQGPTLLLPEPEKCSAADYVVVESTYGGTVRGSGPGEAGLPHAGFITEVGKALRRGGDVLVPAFTLGRTQEVIAALHLGIETGLIPSDCLIYSDSPTANRITKIYRDMSSYLSTGGPESLTGEALLSPSNLREVRSKTSMKVHSRSHVPSVFVSSSGDLRHANSPRHLFRMASDEDALLCIVGWQPPGSPGRKLERGESPVLIRHSEGGRMERHWIAPALDVLRFRSFSSHADQDGLMEWLSSIEGVRRVFIVHGEPDQSEGLRDRLVEETGVDASVPGPMESVRLDWPPGRDMPAGAADGR